MANEGFNYEGVVERARAAAAAKRYSGAVPEGTNAALDRLFVEVAPGGARADGEGIDAMVEMLGRYRFDPSIPVATAPGMRGRAAAMLKRVLQPVAAWQLRHLTDQLNAYHQAETELLRALLAVRGAPATQANAAGDAAGGPAAGQRDPAGDAAGGPAAGQRDPAREDPGPPGSGRRDPGQAGPTHTSEL
jgi:hypothetical protein